MTGTLPRIAVVAAVTVVLVTVAALHPRQRHGTRPTIAASAASSAGAAVVARAFVEAFVHVDRADPHGDLATMRLLCQAALLRQLRTASTSLTSVQLQADVSQRGRVTSVATHLDRAMAISFVTTLISEADRRAPVLRTADTYTVTLRRTGATWLVIGVTA